MILWFKFSSYKFPKYFLPSALSFRNFKLHSTAFETFRFHVITPNTPRLCNRFNIRLLFFISNQLLVLFGFRSWFAFFICYFLTHDMPNIFLHASFKNMLWFWRLSILVRFFILCIVESHTKCWTLTTDTFDNNVYEFFYTTTEWTRKYKFLVKTFSRTFMHQTESTLLPCKNIATVTASVIWSGNIELMPIVITQVETLYTNTTLTR